MPDASLGVYENKFLSFHEFFFWLLKKLPRVGFEPTAVILEGFHPPYFTAPNPLVG